MRLRRTSALLLLLSLSACSKRTVAPEPFVGNEPGPDLRAEEVYLFEPSWPIGSRTPAPPEPRHVMRASASAIPAELGEVIVGVGLLPGIRQSCVGSFHGYKIRYYANDVLWWERDTDTQSPQGVRLWEGFHGLFWAPPDTGTYAIRVVLDATNRFDELDEKNNVAIGIVHSVPGDVSAAVEFRGLDGNFVHTVRAGTTIRVIAGVGAHGIYPNVRRVLARDGTSQIDGRLDMRGGAIAAVHYDTLSFTPMSPGNYTWMMTVDPDHETLDRTRDNNVGSGTLNVVPYP
jgi:hypothetical protein